MAAGTRMLGSEGQRFHYTQKPEQTKTELHLPSFLKPARTPKKASDKKNNVPCVEFGLQSSEEVTQFCFHWSCNQGQNIQLDDRI